MKLCRFHLETHAPRIGLIAGPGESKCIDLTPFNVTSLEAILEQDAPTEFVKSLAVDEHAGLPIEKIKLLPPLERQEVWAAGVTYLRSKAARMEESEFSATAYDRVYSAQRPELFFKSMPDKVVAHHAPVGIRSDANWSVPEPELALVLNSRGILVGYTIGNDMSSRDIEGENLLYLPQAKIYGRSCALGPFIVIGASEKEARSWSLQLQVARNDEVVFEGQTEVSQIKRGFSELIEFLFHSQQFPHGAILLTGTGVVPPDTFSLTPGDTVEINVSGIGTLTDPVVLV